MGVITELPIFVRAGTILPLLLDAVDSFYGATNAGVTDLDDAANDLRLAMYPNAGGALDELVLSGSTITGTWPVQAVDYSLATVDGQGLPDCTTVGLTTSCYGPNFVRFYGASGTVEVGTRAVAFLGTLARAYQLATGADAWGDYAAATPLTDLNPDIPPPCEAQP